MKIKFYDPDKEKPQKEGGLTLDWISNLGWHKNPFEITDVILSDMDEERQEINLFFIKKKKLGIIKGGEGLGKTTLLTWLAEELKKYKEMKVVLLNSREVASHEDFLVRIADNYRSFLSKGKPISLEQLIELINKKDSLVLLIDDAHTLPITCFEIISELVKTNCSAVLTTTENIKQLQKLDELNLNLKKRSLDAYLQILKQRIELAGGVGIEPFVRDEIKTIAKKAANTRDFLNLCMEEAIHKSINKQTVDDKEPPKKEQKHKYDDFIESLTEDI